MGWVGLGGTVQPMVGHLTQKLGVSSASTWPRESGDSTNHVPPNPNHPTAPCQTRLKAGPEANKRSRGSRKSGKNEGKCDEMRCGKDKHRALLENIPVASEDRVSVLG